MPITVYNINKIKILVEDRPLAAPGGEGAVHRVIANARYGNACVKIYHELKRTSTKKSKIEFMIINKPASLHTENFIICWPQEIVYDGSGKFLGFIMPVAFSGSIKLYELATAKLNSKLNQGHHSQWNKFERTSKTGIEKRLKICVNISIALHLIHSAGNYSIVDYKPQNILITKEGKISIIDVDSFQIGENGKVIFHAEVATPEYAPPEAVRLNPSKNFIPDNWDRFSFAVSFYEILLGIHPFTATCNGQYVNATTIGEKIQKGLFVYGSKKNYLTVIPPLHSNFNTLPVAIRNLFIKSFEDGHTNPDSRPQAEIWGQTIVTELMTGSTIRANTFSIVKQTKHTTAYIGNQTQAEGTTAYSIKSTYQSAPVTTTSSTQKMIPQNSDPSFWWILLITGVIILNVFLITKGCQGEKKSYPDYSTVTYDTRKISTSTRADQDSENESPLSVISISFKNVNEAKTLGYYSFSSSGLKLLQPVIEYYSNVLKETKTTIYYVVYDPHGNLLQDSDSPYGYTSFTDVTIRGDYSSYNTMSLLPFRLDSANNRHRRPLIGKYKVIVWCRSEEIGKSSFTVTD